LSLKPFALTGATTGAVAGSAVDVTREIGLDAKISVSSTLVADVTVNTDFAQVEADQQQINLTRFPLFFPEKREFFLENAGLFQIGERLRPFEAPGTLLFFSRRIGLTADGDRVPLLGGVRVTGRVGAYDIGFLDIASRAIRLADDAMVPATNFVAARVKRNVLARSSVGGFLFSKSAGADASNHVAGGDVNLAFAGHGVLTGFLARSAASERAGSHAAAVDGGWESDRLFLTGTYLDIGDDFEAQMGFVPRTGIRKFRGSAALGTRPGRAGIRQLFFGNDHQYYADRAGRLQSQVNNLGPGMIFHNGSFLFGAWSRAAEGLIKPFEIRRGVLIAPGTYRFNQGVLFYSGDQSRTLSLRGNLALGGFYHGTLRAVTVGGRYRPHPRVNLELDYTRNAVALPLPGGRFTTRLVVTRAGYAFSPYAFVRALIQVNENDTVAMNMLFRYTYRPGADLFVVYNEERAIGGRRSANGRRELLAKVTIYMMQ
jgi:hypothetical protein